MTKVNALMTGNVVTVVGLLCGIVTDRDRRIVGIVTETDLLRRIVGADACCADVQAIVVSYP